MRIIALLSWYDEKHSWLAELVASLGRAGVDHLVCCDGAYAAYPEAKGNSGSEQGETISAAAIGSGMGVTVHQPRNLDPWWGNEVEKRTALFALGHLVADPGDWLLIVDADEVAQTTINRERLAKITEDVAEVMITQRGGKQFPMRKLFRAQPGGITVQGYHARYVAGDGRVLWGPSGEIVPEVGDMWDFRVRHRPDERHSWRRADKKEYYRLVQTLKLEDT